MKLEQIRINGFGVLNDLTIDLEPDLTVIYGLNGSGKSTLLNFFRSVIYGFYQRGSTRRYEPLRGGSHGGSILVADEGKRYLLTRTSGRRSGGVLFIEDLQTGVSLPEDYVQKLTGGISQSLFETVYAFGLPELQQLRFLQDQDLSALLYSIGLGASISLADIYERLANTMDGIYKARGSKPELNRILGLLQENTAGLKALSTVSLEYQALIAGIEAKKQEAAELRHAAEEKKRELQQIKLRLEAWPHWQRLLIVREKLQHLPELSMPENASVRLQSLQTELKAAEEKYNQTRAKLPAAVNPAAVEAIDLNQLKLDFAAAAAEFEQIKPQLDVAAERYKTLQEEWAAADHELTAVTEEIAGLGMGKLEPEDLAVRRQWLEELRTAQQESKTTSNSFVSAVLLALASGLLVFSAFLFSEKLGMAVWLNASAAALVLIWFGKEQLEHHRTAQNRKQRIHQLIAQLGINSADELAIADARLTRAEALCEELEQLKRNMQRSQAKLAASRQNLQEKQEQMDAVNRKLQEMLNRYSLPTHLGLHELKAFLDVMGGLRDLLARQKELRHDLEEIYRLCGTSDHERIAHMDQIQKERRELIQEAANLEIILQTYLGRKGTELEELFQNLTKAELVQMEEQLEAEIDQLTAAFEQLQEALGGLTVKREMLEQSQKQEELQQEREMLQAKARNLAVQWASLHICRWAIEQVSRKYEQERQPEVLRLASEYFTVITDQRYRRVYAPIGMQEIKIETASGDILSPSQLSQGTMEQLYLAIRFALAVQIAQERVEIPIFADDILVNFDRYRLANTIELMRRLSSQHQIILLTCHQRIANLFDRRHVRHLDELASSTAEHLG
jgi:uncharacterized protein YhaN